MIVVLVLFVAGAIWRYYVKKSSDIRLLAHSHYDYQLDNPNMCKLVPGDYLLQKQLITQNLRLRSKFKKGTYVKIAVTSTVGHLVVMEHFWVRITKVQFAGIGWITGQLMNVPQYNDELKLDDQLVFRKKQIEDIWHE